MFAPANCCYCMAALTNEKPLIISGQHVGLLHAALACDGNAPTHKAEFADRMGIWIYAEQTSELEGAPMPAPVKLQPVGIAVDLDRHATRRADLENLFDIYVVAGSPQQKA